MEFLILEVPLIKGGRGDGILESSPHRSIRGNLKFGKTNQFFCIVSAFICVYLCLSVVNFLYSDLGKRVHELLNTTEDESLSFSTPDSQLSTQI
jgi:hypothetical protein